MGGGIDRNLQLSLLTTFIDLHLHIRVPANLHKLSTGFPSRAAAVFITLSSQLIGYGIAGLLRDVLVYPTKMLWPYNLPVASLLESLHKDKERTKRRLKLFYIVFFILFFWEVVPEVQ